MQRAAILVLADTETHEDFARLANALEVVQEFKEAKDEIQLIFDGAGSKWITELSKPDHRLYDVFNSVKEVASVCSFCATAFGAKPSAEINGIPLLGEYRGHPSVRKLVTEGYEIITF